MMTRVADLRIGDLVDLENDKYADPDNDNHWMPYLLGEVAEVTQETPACVAIAFEYFDIVGFPTGHELDVVGRVGDDPIPNWCAGCGMEGHSDDDPHEGRNTI